MRRLYIGVAYNVETKTVAPSKRGQSISESYGKRRSYGTIAYWRSRLSVRPTLETCIHERKTDGVRLPRGISLKQCKAADHSKPQELIEKFFLDVFAITPTRASKPAFIRVKAGGPPPAFHSGAGCDSAALEIAESSFFPRQR